MSDKKSYYEILGVPRTAATEEIKKRYRELVRKYHPDVAEDKALAKVAFLQIAEAYKTLVNPDKRMIYDATLVVDDFRTRPKQTPKSTYTPHARPAASPPKQHAVNRAAEVNRLIRDAQAEYTMGHFRPAILACQEAARLDPRNVQAHVILGDIYRIQGLSERALSEYSIVLQLDPRNMDVQAKLDRMTRGSRRDEEETVEKRTSFKLGILMVGGCLVVAILIWLSMSPGVSSAWFASHLAVVSTWNAKLVFVMILEGFLAGFVLSLGGMVNNLEDSLIFRGLSVSKTGGRVPTGLVLVILNFLNFYLAAFVYAIMGLLQESFSVSVLRAFAVTVIIAVGVAAAGSSASGQVLLFGGNVVFPFMLLGWRVGDSMRPAW